MRLVAILLVAGACHRRFQHVHEPPAAGLDGRMVHARGEVHDLDSDAPVADAVVIAVATGGDRFVATTDEHGVWRLELPATDFTIDVYRGNLMVESHATVKMDQEEQTLPPIRIAR